MSEWNTRITKVQPVQTQGDTGPSCLVFIYPPGPFMGRRFPLDEEKMLVGRGSDVSILIDRDSVSRQHARLFQIDEMWMVEDLDSTNGTYVNDLPVKRSPLSNGDFLKIGSVIFKFLSGVGIETSYHEEIYRMTIIDGLTGAHNKRYFLEFLEREIARCARYQRPLSLLMFDIDHFKKVNDTRGHLTGDYVLKELSRRMRARIRKEELFARYGGEEFAIVLPETDPETARHVAEQIRRLAADEPFEYEGETFTCTISVGLCTLLGESIEPSEFIKRTDDKLYEAKRSGRNRVVAD